MLNKIFSILAAFALAISISSAAYAQRGKPLSDGKLGHDFGCAVMGTFAPELGACLENAYNSDRYNDAMARNHRSPEIYQFDNPFIHQDFNSGGSGGGASTRLDDQRISPTMNEGLFLD